MTEYTKINTKLSDSQLKSIKKSSQKRKRINFKVRL